MPNRITSMLLAAFATMLLTAMPVDGDAEAAPSKHSGRWVMMQSTTTVSQVPVVGKIYSTTRAVTLHDLEHADNRLRGGGKICAVAVDSGSRFVTTTIPKALQRALPPPRIDARIGKRGGKTTLRQKRQTIVVGARLKHPTRDLLPTSLDDRRLHDLDRDGHPGVTIGIGGIVSGDLRVVQRSWTSLSGTQRGKGFRGRLNFGVEQVILDATSSMLRDPPKSQALPAKSYFRLEPVAKDTNCAGARRAARSW
jgi:hypothetical protein